jgi:hypothetical protein
VGARDVNIWPEGTLCCCVCWTSAPVWIVGNTFIEWWDMGAPLHTKVSVVQYGMASQVITTKEIQNTAVSWMDHGRCVLGFRKSDSCWFSSTWCNSAEYHHKLLHREVHQVKTWETQRWWSFCMTVLVYIWKIRWMWHWQQWAGKSYTTLFTALT